MTMAPEQRAKVLVHAIVHAPGGMDVHEAERMIADALRAAETDAVKKARLDKNARIAATARENAQRTRCPSCDRGNALNFDRWCKHCGERAPETFEMTRPRWEDMPR